MFNSESNENIFQLDTKKNSKDSILELVLDYDYGATVSVAALYPNSEHFLLLKENGSIQLWNAKNGQLTNRFSLGQEVIVLM